MATKTVEQSALTNMSQSTRIVSTGDQANELLGKAIALCHLCLVQVGGEVSDSERVEFRWVVATAEHMLALMRKCEALDIDLDAAAELHVGIAQAVLLFSDMTLVDGKQHLNDDLVGWALWSICDSLERAKAIVDGEPPTQSH